MASHGVPSSLRNLRLLALTCFVLSACGIPRAAADYDDVLGTFNGPAPGAPRAWQGGLQVTPYSVFNLYNANTLTTIPLVAFDPAGPPLRFVLYHNTADAAANRTCAAGTGWHLGYGWSTSYSGRVEGDPAGDVTVIADDGTREIFEYDAGSGRYLPAPWNHDRLEFAEDYEYEPNQVADVWILTLPSQWERIYTYDLSAHVGRLIQERDSLGLTVKVVRDGSNRITEIRSAAYGLSAVGDTHKLSLTTPADPNNADYGLLTELTDPIDRQWDFDHSGTTNRRVAEIHFPTDDYVDPSNIALTYYTVGRYVHVLTDRDILAWDYGYSGSKLTSVADRPENYTGDPNETTTQTFLGIGIINDPNYTGARVIEDRRDKTWRYSFDSTGHMRKAEDPLSHRVLMEYDSARNLTEYTDELNHVWNATYSPVGQAATLTNPLSKTWTYTWTPVGDPNDTNFYRLTKVNDPLGDWVRYKYADPQDPNDPPDPTLVTEIIEMPATGEDPNAVTRLEYYVDDPNEPRTSSHGQLQHVIDANGVVTEFHYDKWGYQSLYREGLAESLLRSLPEWVLPFQAGQVCNGVGGVIGTSAATGQGENTLSVNGTTQLAVCCIPELIGTPACPLIRSGGSPPAVPTEPARLGNVPTPLYGYQSQCLDDATYDIVGRPLSLTRCIPNLTGAAGLEDIEANRKHIITYDPFRRPESMTIQSLPDGSEDAAVERATQVLDYDEEGRPLQLLDAEQNLAEIAYDDVGRVATVTRLGVEMGYEYDDAGRLVRVEYDGVAAAIYDYDDADRLVEILHQDAEQNLLLQITYAYLDDNTVDYRTEYDVIRGSLATVDFTYDHRKRLTREVRDQDGQVVYDISYTYDPLGNRKTRIDAIAQQRVDYTYDTDYEDPLELDYPTRHNRLLQYEVRAGVDPNDPVVRTVKYIYWLTGNASNITIKDEYIDAETTPGDPNDYDWYHDLALYYFTNGQLWRAQRGKWKNFPESSRPDPATYEPLGVREFRYDDPRGRYLAADYAGGLMDPNHPGGTLDLQWPLNWTDYLGATPLGDAQVDYDSGPPATWPVTATTDYLLALYGQQEAATGDTTFYHEDLIGSTTLTSDDGGTAVSAVAYTAFGEYVALTATQDPNDPNAVIWTASIGGQPPGGFPRYGYAGAYGYESSLLAVTGPNGALSPVLLQHIGTRFYSPAVGRFVERDSLGVRGALNVYVYTDLSPVNGVDPIGTDHVFTGGRWLHGGIAIEDPSRNGDWWQCDYLPEHIPRLWDKGKVQISMQKSAPPGTRFPSPPDADRRALAVIHRWKANPPYYMVPFRCCHSMVSDVAPILRRSPVENPWCVSEGTLVSVHDELAPIECLDIGATLDAYDRTNHRPVRASLGAIRTTLTRDVLDVVVAGETLRVTSSHPFLARSRGWVSAGRIVAGDELICATGTPIRVDAVLSVRLEEPIRVYDLRVTGPHTYMLGAHRLVVHNKRLDY